MRFHFARKVWLPVFAFLVFCLLGLAFGCIKGKKKEAKFVPGEEWMADMRGRVEASIADPDKKNQMMLLVDQMGTGLIELDRAVLKHYSNLRKISRNYHSTPEDFKKAFADFNADRYQIRDQIIEARFKMRDLSTTEEWKKLTDIKEKNGLFKESLRFPGQKSAHFVKTQ